MNDHDVMLAADNFYECRCGHIATSRFGHEAHLSEVGQPVEDDPNEPTLDVNFDPKNWTGTVVSGLISSRSECGLCGSPWTDGHECPRS